MAPRNRFLVKGGGPVWSPDGTRIAYVAAAEEPKGAQIFVRWMDAEGATSQVTRVADGPGSAALVARRQVDRVRDVHAEGRRVGHRDAGGPGQRQVDRRRRGW